MAQTRGPYSPVADIKQGALAAVTSKSQLLAKTALPLGGVKVDPLNICRKDGGVCS